MSKAILVMEMPESCRKCCLREMSYSNFDKSICVPTQKSLDKFSKVKPGWCPIRELPKEKHNDLYLDEYSDGYDDGWNECIDEILRM